MSVSWYVVQNEQARETEEHHLGTFKKDELIIADLVIWNNRWGVEDAKDIVSPVLSVEFDAFEDSALLDGLKITVDNVELPVLVRDTSGTVLLQNSLSGKSNDGDADNTSNKVNFAKVTISIDTAGKSLKENDLKKMYLEVRELN